MKKESISGYNKTKNDALHYYGSINKVHCPYLKEEVHFNRKGIDHLLYKSDRKRRSRKQQLIRLRLISKAVKIINKSHTLQEYVERDCLARQKINSRWEKRMKRVYYYVFVGIIDNVRLKVVIKEIEGGVKYFYSLYPSWKVKSDGSKKFFFGIFRK